MKKYFLIALIPFWSCGEPKQTESEAKPQPISINQIFPLARTTALIKTDTVNIRSEPNANSRILGILNKGTPVAVEGRSGTRAIVYKCEHYWFKIKSQKTEGWVYGQFLEQFVEKGRKTVGIPDEVSGIQLQVPDSWDTRSVWHDIEGEKIAEDHPIREYAGDFQEFVRKQNTDSKTPGGDTIIHSIGKIQHPKLQIMRVVSEVTYEGGCPKWVGVWYPTVYYFRISENQYISLTLYLRELSDTQTASLFDNIAKSIVLY